MTTSSSSTNRSSSPRIKLRGNGHSAGQQKKNKPQSSPTDKSQRLILRTPDNSRLMKGTAPLPGAGPSANSIAAVKNGYLVKRAFKNELAKVFKLKGRADTLSGLEAIAATVIRLARKGSIPAAREVFDRVDGRPAQTIIGDPENPVYFKAVSEMSDEELEVVARGHVINGTAERVD